MNRSNKKSVPTELTDQISQKLKTMYREVEDEGIPERFLDLLEQLDLAEKKQRRELD